MSDKGLWKGFDRIQELSLEPRFMCAVLSEQLARTNLALITLSEEVKQLREKETKEENKE